MTTLDREALVADLRSGARKVTALRNIAGLRGAAITTLNRLQETAERAANYLDALSSLPAQAVGVKLVPVEKLTPEMRAAAETAARKINPGRSEDHIKSVALDGLSIYRAIVAAAP